MAPRDSAPISNLSAVSFETGRYLDAVNFIRQALELSESDSDQEPKRQKLYARLIKSLMYTNKIEEAQKVLSYLTDTYTSEGFSKDILRTNIAAILDLQASATDTSQLRLQILDRLPLYKPNL